MAKDNELKESVKKPIKELVREIVSDTVYKLAKVSAKKAVIALRDRLKEEAARRLEKKLKETVEKRLKQTAKKLEREFSQDTPWNQEYISKIKQGFEKGLQKLLSPPSMGPFISIVMASVFVVGGLIGWQVTDHLIEPTPPLPQPDLVISAITFDIEGPPLTEVPPPITYMPEWAGEDISSYQITIHYTIENQGDEEAGESICRLFLNGEAAAEALVDPLPAGETAEGAFYDYTFSAECVLPYLYSGHVEIELCADCGENVAESNEENNCITLEANIPH
jgi:hypothetical protein